LKVNKFNEKLNKINGNAYVVEEIIDVINGVYEAELTHDNVNPTTLNVYTSSKLTGDKVNTYTTSTPSLTPWKTVIKIYSKVSPLYISYETSGDTVEVEDINNLQDAVVDTQVNLNSEINRAINRENNIENNLNSEISRAKGSENTITNNLNSEVSRAQNAESTLTSNLTNEVNRAKAAEGTLTLNLNSEITRATNAENSLTNNLNSEITRAKAAENTLNNTINTNKPIWDDKYTKNEIDNKFNVLTTNLDWKESVATFSSITTTYLTPDDGWTVNVKDTDITYRYDGTAWIPISANSIPLATSSVDGKMSKQDKIDHDDMVSKRHTHSNKSILDIITQTLIDNWNAAFTHVSDAVRHITATERSNWNTAYTNNHTHSNKSVLDTITQALIDTWNVAYTHISDSVKHITSTERTSWNNKLDSTANAVSANKWATARTFNLTGDVTGSANVDGSSNVSITTTVADDSHNHTSATITDFLAAVRGTVLTGLSTATNSIISVTDTVLTALGKLQAQITANLNTLTSHTGNTSNPHSTTASQIGLGNVTNDSQVKRSEMGVANGVATLDSLGVNNQTPKAHTHDDRYYTETESDAKYATKAEISVAGYGDMLKFVYDTDNDGIVDNAETATKLSTARTINGISFDGSGNIVIPTLYDANYRSIINPSGAIYNTNTATVTGAIAITLPVGMTNTMLRMSIRVYEYATNKSFDIYCGGYTYLSGNTWANNPFAYIVGNSTIDRRFSVRFGYTSGGKAIIYIGEANSTWSYPQVVITDVQCGYGGQSINYTTGWSIGFVTVFENVTATISNCQVGYAVSTNTANATVLRDASGNFSAGTITASLSGNASTATKLATARAINLTGDVTGTASFDGSGDVTITTNIKTGLIWNDLEGV
jgi:hypothetical protein